MGKKEITEQDIKDVCSPRIRDRITAGRFAISTMEVMPMPSAQMPNTRFSFSLNSVDRRPPSVAPAIPPMTMASVLQITPMGMFQPPESDLRIASV